MENVFDFLRAALPWIVMGLLLAVFAARSAGKKKKEKEIDNYGIEGMCLGMCFDKLLVSYGDAGRIFNHDIAECHVQPLFLLNGCLVSLSILWYSPRTSTVNFSTFSRVLMPK